jgi:hypothetical protein
VNLRASAVVLRPRGVFEIIDLAFRFVRARALPLYARLAALLLLPSFAGCLALRYALALPWSGAWITAISLGTVIQGAFTVAIGRLFFSAEVSAREALGAFARRLPSYLAALLGSRLILALSALTVILPIVAWPRIFFVHEASLLEGGRAGAAIQRGDRLASGRFGAVVGSLLAVLGLQAVFVIASEILGQGIVADLLQLGEPFGSLRENDGSPYALAGYFLSVPYAAAARYLAYIDMRTRTDGWDVQVRFLCIAAEDRGEDKEAA